MTELPVCRWRYEPTVGGHHKCRSPKLIHGPNGVSDELCATCHLCDHPRPPFAELVRLWFLRLGLRRPVFRIRFRRYLRFVRAVLRHALAGFPRASDKDVAFRRSKCGPCFWRDKEKDTCTKCTCKLGGQGQLIAKLVWAGEQCPLWDPAKRPGEYWGPVEGEKIWTRLWKRFLGLVHMV